MTTLFVYEGGEYRKAPTHLVLACAEATLSRRIRMGSPVFEQPEAVRTFLRVHLAPLPYEVFGCLYLDHRRRLLAREDLFRGTIDHANVHTREIIRSCIAHAASNLVMYHNHPSARPEPSEADRLVTQIVTQAAALIDVRVLDHWIVADPLYSFAEHGLL